MRMDAAQFERVLADHQRMVFSIALHLLRERALAEEIAQDVFLALHEHGERIESPEHLVHWLRCVTTRKCIDQARRQRWRQRLAYDPGGLEEIAAAPAPGGDPLLARRLERLIRGLPAVARAVLVLRYQEDLDTAEIGRTIGISEPAARKHLTRALAHLKLRLDTNGAAGRRGAAEPATAGKELT